MLTLLEQIEARVYSLVATNNLRLKDRQRTPIVPRYPWRNLYFGAGDFHSLDERGLGCPAGWTSRTRSVGDWLRADSIWGGIRSEEHTSELQSQSNLVCRLLLEKKENS